MNESSLESTTLRKVAWRLVPFICVLYVFNILDRSNLGFARLRMQDDLGLTEAMFNLGYGIFYLGYLAFEVPSNLLLHRFHAEMDCSDHDQLGTHVVMHDVCDGSVDVLWTSHSAGSGRSGLLSGHHSIPELLISVVQGASPVSDYYFIRWLKPTVQEIS